MKSAALAFALLASARTGLGQIEPDQLLTIPHILRTPLVSGFSVAPDGKHVALNLSVLGKETIWLISGDAGPGAAVATTKGTGERDVDWSPDGNAMAFVSNRDGAWNLYVADSKGANARPVLLHSGEDRRPRWAPDGKRLAFLSRRESSGTSWGLWLADLRGGEPAEKRVTELRSDPGDPQWAPDGSLIAISIGGENRESRRIGIVSVESGELRDLLPESWKGDSFTPRWFPDGNRIVFVSDEPGKKSLFTTPVKGGDPTLISSSDYELTEPAISPDGRHLAYVENRDGDSKLMICDLDSDQRRMLTLRNGVHSQPAWRPDGSAVLSLFEAWNYSRDVWAYLLDGGRERISDTLPPDLDVRKMVRPELVKYPSFDGREITGYLYLPEQASAASPARLLVRPHGGPTSQWLDGWHPFAQLLAQKGYAVFAPNVRGSTGFGVAFEHLNDGDWGRGDLEDLVAGTKYVLARPEIRHDRAGIWGVSYGGFLVLAAIARHPDLFTCAIEALGMPDLELLYRETTDEGRTYLDRELGPLRGNLSRYRELSPIRDVDRIKTPLLSFHGEVYPLVPYSSKRPFFDALRKRPTFPLQEYMFKGEQARATYRHDLNPEAAWAYVEKILEFLDVYL
jgi:dipeptidyl aminopeptidase/acylaminoacyl peptidase